MALLSSVIGVGTHAARPAAGSAGVLYFETDTYTLFRDNGSSWDAVGWPSTPPAARVYNSANISTATGVFTYLTFDSERVDRGTATEQHSTSANTGRLTCRVAGFYQIGANVRLAGATGGTQRGLQIRLNGTTAISQKVTSPEATNNVDLDISTGYDLAVGDYVELGSYQDSGGNLNVVAAGNYSPEFYWSRVA